MTAEQKTDEDSTTRTQEDGASDDNREARDHADDNHLSDVPDGSGCTEIWEHLSEERDDDD